MQEPMITEVVISVGDQDREGYPPPELAQVSCRGRGPFLDEDVTVADTDQLGIRNLDPRVPRQVKCDFFPCHHIPGVRACTRELGHSDMASTVRHVPFRAGTA